MSRKTPAVLTFVTVPLTTSPTLISSSGLVHRCQWSGHWVGGPGRRQGKEMRQA